MSAPEDYGPWNPGLQSDLPRAWQALATVYRPENVETPLAEAEELADFTGLPAHDLVRFRPGRLVVHELLLRITADFDVPDGSHYGDLGINFREIAGALLEGPLKARMQTFEDVLAGLQGRAGVEVLRLLEAGEGNAGSPPPKARKGWFSRWFGAKADQSSPPAPASRDELDRARIDAWQRAGRENSADAFAAACNRALAQVAGAVMRRHGRLIGDKALIVKLAVTLISNELGSALVGEAMQPVIAAAAADRGYRLLPANPSPVVLNVKGASAAGKSTLRPLQRKLVERLGLNWSDFALISPDIWRKFLLDYDSLGEAYKYAGTMTGHELEMIDRKLDAYMATKAAAGRMSHLLIDRFRFDSFVPGSDEDASSRLLSRFGDPVYLFFMVTPPDATVERAWGRGLKVGRYKAVDDLLDHNVEAFTGMPQLFLAWALKTRKKVHYEFLDNSVPLGTRPRTIAFGWNGSMTILDIKGMIDIERFRKVNIEAQNPQEVYCETDLSLVANLAFLAQCVKYIPQVTFADFDTGEPYLRVERGTVVWRNPAILADKLNSAEFGAGLEWLLAGSDGEAGTAGPLPQDARQHTLGAWGQGKA